MAITEVARILKHEYMEACPLCGVSVSQAPFEFLGHCLKSHPGSGALTPTQKIATISSSPTHVNADFRGLRDNKDDTQFQPDHFCPLCLSHYATAAELVVHLAAAHDIS